MWQRVPSNLTQDIISDKICFLEPVRNPFQEPQVTFAHYIVMWMRPPKLDRRWQEISGRRRGLRTWEGSSASSTNGKCQCDVGTVTAERSWHRLTAEGWKWFSGCFFDDYHHKSSILSSDHFIWMCSHSSREESSLTKISAFGLCLKDKQLYRIPVLTSSYCYTMSVCMLCESLIYL